MDIPQIKKEKNERRIQQKAKLSRMKIEKTVFNVLKSVVADNEERQQKILQEEREEQEPAEYCKLLLDANILHDIFLANEDVITKLKNYEGGNNLLFLILRRIIIEFQNMMKDKFGEPVRYDKVIEKLSLLGKVEEISTDHNSPLVHKATELYWSGKYANKKTGATLSKTDCFLFQYAIEYSCTLITDDRALIDATIENGGDVFNPREP